MAENPELPVVELRVHGVGGGATTDLLEDGPVGRVSGDDLAGFFRDPARARERRGATGTLREVFAWGNLTSGNSSRALWLLLLPFMLVNIAYWMRPRRLGTGASRPHLLANHLYDVVVRLLALSLTAVLTMAAVGIGMDTVAWQCGGYGVECAELRPWLGFLTAPGSLLATPGRALAVGALLPGAVVLVLWRLSRRTGAEYEAVFKGRETGTPSDRPGAAAAEDPPIHRRDAPLSHPRFWRGYRLVGLFRSAHIAVACCVIAGWLVAPALRWDWGTAMDPLSALAGWLLASTLICVVVLSALAVCVTGSRDTAFLDRGYAVLRGLAVVTLLLSAAYAALWPRPGWAAEGPLPGFDTAFTALFMAQGLLAAALLALAVALYRGSGSRAHTAMRGLAGPVTVVIGLLLGGVFSAALGHQAAEWLGGCLYRGAEEAGCLVLQPPSAYAWLQFAFTLTAGALLAALVVLWLVVRQRARRNVAGVLRDYATESGGEESGEEGHTGRIPSRAQDIARARALGSLTELLPAVLLLLIVPAVVTAAGAGYLTLRGWLAPGSPPGPEELAATLGPRTEAAMSLTVGAGAILGGLFLALVMWLGRNAYRNQPTRQAIGVLWDIGTFWPRAAHPLAPPCYAERAIPQLTSRVCMLSDQGHKVVLSGHSQGSVLAAATAWQLPERYRDRIALLTHGSPLYRLYARYFPAYFGPVALNRLTEGVAGWYNLWRDTDMIGGRTHQRKAGAGIDWFLRDPWRYERPEGEALLPGILGHSWYTMDDAYAEALGRLAAKARSREPGGAESREPEGSAAEPGPAVGSGG